MGVFAIGHHDYFNVFQEWEEEIIEEIVNDPEVIAQVQAVNQATTLEKRTGAIERLMETLE